MKHLFEIVLLAELFIQGLMYEAWPNFETKSPEKNSSLELLLQNIYKEREFETLLLIAEPESYKDLLIWGTLERLMVPKVLVTNDPGYEFVRTFNAEILTIFLFQKHVNPNLMAMGAEILNFMRQSRILILIEEVENEVENLDPGVLWHLLQHCESYKMTNVLVRGLHDPRAGNILQLKPYPVYNWSRWQSDSPYYPQHWHNMENKSVTYFTDTTMTLSYPFEDGRGGVKLNGYIARLVLLFGEIFNAHMHMYASHEVAARTHLTQVNQMVEDNRIDIPMTLSHYNDGKWLYKSAVYDSLAGLLMIPSALPLSTREVYGVLLNRYFFGSIIIGTLIFSGFQFLVDYFLDRNLHILDLVLNYRFFSGVLGQSFAPRESCWRSLKMVYFLVFVAGLNISTQFSATINTLITSPPNHPQIQSFEDLKNSRLKILAITSDIEAIEDAGDIIKDSLLLTDSVEYYEENRNSYNTSTGYFLVSLSWKVLKRKQQYYSHNIFNVYEKMTLFSMPCALQLQKHSPYKEPLDYLINRVHAVGLPEYWYASTFGDMLRTKRISINANTTSKEFQPLEVRDLFWPWISIAAGLAAGGVIFLAEILIYRTLRKLQKNK
ncbi:uncharacterized protein LOC133338611 [Musca vetustissima]|uniref:uncharacterized protein LOC133338611 n=1 Tax=Musca vetustissima TaxID=27455 RepID=UPI002AB63B1B|nr:uncharacterized protein LOC133338611 [Musca vetustissima]